MRSLTALFAGTVLAIAGAAQAQESITLEVVHAWPGHASYHVPIAEAFMEQHPNIKIEFRAPLPSYDEGHQKILRDALIDQLPDVYYSGYHLLPSLVRTLRERGQITDLTPFLAEEPADWVDANYAESILELSQVDGRQFGMSSTASTPMVYYNADLVSQAGGDPDHFPDSWDDVISLATRISALGDDIDGISYDVQAWPDDWLWQAVVFQNGGRMTNESETAAAFGDEAGLAALNLLRRLVTDAGMVVHGDYNPARQQFFSGKLGIVFSSPRSVSGFTESVGDSFTMSTAVYPIDNKEEGGIPTGGNSAVILTQDQEKQAAAWTYLKFVSGPVGQQLTVENTGYMPTNRQTNTPEFLGDFYKENANWATVLGQADRSRSWYAYPGNEGVRIWRAQREIITAVMRGHVTPEAGLAEMVEKTNALLPN